MEGYLEVSNVDLTAEFTGLIEAQRAYGFALKMVQTSDEVEQTIVNLR
jgi:flagellar basal-body rod protein FlgG